MVVPMLKARDDLRRQIDVLHRMLLRATKEHPVCRSTTRSWKVAGVTGPILSPKALSLPRISLSIASWACRC
jgi:hypothetical protein